MDDQLREKGLSVRFRPVVPIETGDTMSRSRGKFTSYDVMMNDTGPAAVFYSDRTGRVAEEHAILGITISEELRADRAPPCWFGYVGTDDIDSDAGRIWTAGGTIMRPPQDIPNVGRFALVSNSGGAVFLLFQPNTEEQPKPVAPKTRVIPAGAPR